MNMCKTQQFSPPRFDLAPTRFWIIVTNTFRAMDRLYPVDKETRRQIWANSQLGDNWMEDIFSNYGMHMSHMPQNYLFSWQKCLSIISFRMYHKMDMPMLTILASDKTSDSASEFWQFLGSCKNFAKRTK